MISKTLKIVIQSNGDYLDVSLPNIVANEKGRSVIQVIAPFPTTDIVSVNYSVRPIQADIPSQYLLPTGLFGKDVFAEDYTYFQTVAYWNVFEIPISSKALEYISKYRAGMVLASFTIAQQQVPYLAAEYKGTFDLENPIPTTNHNDGDYYVVNDYNFIWYGITWTKGDYAYYRNGEWIKGKNRLVAQASSIELPVDPSIKGQPTIDYDEDVALLLAQDLGLLTQRVSQSETDIESAENDINEIDGRVGVNETDVYNLESDVGNLQSDKADKTELVPINNELLRLEQDKADTTYVDAQDQALQSQIEGNDNDILSLQSTKVPKTTTIIGLDLQDNILIGEFRTALGNATQSVAGLLSAEDKTHLDGLVALLETSDGNNVVDTIGEILQIFQNYPEGADLVTVLQGKVDKVAGKGLSTNDFTDLLNAKLDSLLDGTQYYDKTYIDALKDNNGWESELLGTLSNNGTIALSIINQYDEIQMYAKDTLGVIDNENIRPNLMQSGDSVYFFDDTQAFIMVDTVFGFYAPAGYTLQVVGLKYTELKAEDVSTKEVGVSVQDKLDKFDENVSLSTENDWDLETIFTEKFPNSRNGWVQVDNEFYIFGGAHFLGTGPEFNYSNELSKKAYKYNAITKQLTELSDFPIAINELRGVYKDGFIYLIGQDVYSVEDLDKTYKYEISTDTYTLITNPPVRIRFSSGAVLVGNKIYVFVDEYYPGNNPSVRTNTTPYIYDISLDSWSVGQPTNLTFNKGFATYYNGLIYVQRSLMFQAYTPTTDTWITDLTPPTYGLVHTGLMHEYKGRLFIGSGWESAKAKNNPFIQYYDVAEDKWFVATRLEFKNHALGYGSTFLYENKLYYIGGYSNEAEPNFNNLIRSFDLEKLQFEEIDYQRQLIQNNKVELVASNVATSEVGVSVQDKLDEIDLGLEQKVDKVETRQVGESIITYESGVIVSVSSDNVLEAIEYDVNGEVDKVTSTYADGKVYEETYTKDVNGNITKIMKVEVI